MQRRAVPAFCAIAAHGVEGRLRFTMSRCFEPLRLVGNWELCGVSRSDVGLVAAEWRHVAAPKARGGLLRRLAGYATPVASPWMPCSSASGSA